MVNAESLVQLRSFARFFLVILFFAVCDPANAQDPVFSQYYIHQNYSNPAYAGHTNDFTVSMNSRLQWARVPGVFLSNSLYANMGCNDKAKPLGYGIILFDNIEGQGFLHTFEGAFQLSSKVYFKFGSRRRNGGVLNFNKRYFNNYQKGGRVRRGAYLYGGLQFGLGQKFLDWSKLTFSDQYSPYFEGVQNATYVLPQQGASNVYMDIGAGLRSLIELGQKNKPSFLSLGAAAFHINKPVHTFFNTQVAVEPRYSFFVNYYLGDKLKTGKRDYEYWTLSTSHDIQQGLRTHTTFIYRDIINKKYRTYINNDKRLTIDNAYLALGLGFRRQRFLKFDNNIDAVIICTMVGIDNISIGYSFDMTTSTLRFEETFGTHELSLKIRFYGRNTCRRRECPPPFEFGHEIPKLGM